MIYRIDFVKRSGEFRIEHVHKYVLNRCKTGAKHKPELFGRNVFRNVSLLSN